MIVSKEKIRREYEALAKEEPMHSAIQWTAVKLGMTEEVVLEAINKEKEKA